MINEIKAIDWSQYLGPDCYNPAEVPWALAQLIELKEEQLNSIVYHRVLFAIGNDHRGTYYPAIQDALMYIIKVALADGVEIAKNCALSILIDLYASFEPEIGSYTKISNDGLCRWLRNEVEFNQSELEYLSSNERESVRNRRLATELIECMSDF